MDTPKHRRLKVLLGCYACNPFYGSEPGTGWNFVINIAKHHEVHAIVEQEVGEQDIRKYQIEHADEMKNITFHFIKRKRYRLLRKLWPPSYYWTYRCWQKKAFKLAVELDKTENFDLVHQITLVGYREPGYLWKLGKPFIWGPIGGLNHTKWSIISCMGLYGILFYTGRNIINFFQKRHSYAAKDVAQKTHTLLISDPDSHEQIKKLWGKDAIIMREVGTYSTSHTILNSCHSPEKPLKLCWVGVHEPRKGLNLLIEAITLCRCSVQLEVLGTGPCTDKWKKLASQLKVENNITFHGVVPHEQVFHIMKRCHVFCITSLSEGGTPNIVMEALQCGLPVIALNHCAFASVIDNTCGIKIPVSYRKQIIQDFAKQLDCISENEHLRKKLASGAIKRSQDFTWDSKIKALNQIYADAVT